MVRLLIKKYRILLIIELAIVLLMVAGCFREERVIYSEEDITSSTNAEDNIFIGDSFSLAPGIYQIQVKTNNLESGYAYITVDSINHTFRNFRCNGANIYAHQRELQFEVYALDKIDSASLRCVFLDNTEGKIDSIELRYSNQSMYMLLFIFVSICIVFDFLLFFREAILKGQIKKEQQVVFWGLLSCVFIAYFPYLTNYFGDAADLGFHWLRIEGLKDTLLNGNQFPVRVQSYWLYDHGYAVSSFYGDLFIFIPVFFRLIGFSLMNSYKMFVFIITVLTAIISYYAFKRCTKDTYAAFFGSVIYMLSPYRIYNFYNRGAVGEFIAMAFLPLVICGMYGLYTENIKDEKYQKAKIPLIVGLTCILQSHLLTTEMIIVIILAICIVFWKKTFRKETFTQLFLSAIICLLINCWFWLPLLKMLASDTYYLNAIISNNIQYMGTWMAEVFQLFPNMGQAQNGMYMAEPFQVGISCLVMLIISIGVVLGRKIHKDQELNYNRYDKIVLFFAFLVIGFWFMSTRYFPWDLIARIPLIKTLATAIQFPTRLFVFVSVFSALHASFFFLWIKEECKNRYGSREWVKKYFVGFIFALSALSVGTAIYHVNDIAFLETPMWLYNGENMGSVSVVYGEYLLEESTLEEYGYEEPRTSVGLEYENYNKNGTSINISVKNLSTDETYLELPLTGYKGYGLEFLEAENEPYITDSTGKNGNLRIAVPAEYEGELYISYEGFLSYRIAEIISLATMISILIYWLKRSRSKWRREKIQ